MAYLTLFRSVDSTLLDGRHSFSQIVKASTVVGKCSHYVAGEPRLAKLLDEGHPIAGAKHPFVDPHFRLPEELASIRAELDLVLIEIGDGGWITEQINGFISACTTCIQSNSAMVVMLAQTEMPNNLLQLTRGLVSRLARYFRIG